VLLDEPSAGLNRQEKEDLARYLLRMRHEFVPTIVWIEHDMQLVRDLADQVFVLHYGKKLAAGSANEVAKSTRNCPAFQRFSKGWPETRKFLPAFTRSY
jgi:branched-chain amino acid transport system ATP-binding protein